MTTVATGWLRVKRHNPCKICSKPDWCLVAADGTAAICTRTPNAHEVKGRHGAFVGYLHRLNGSESPPPRTSDVPEPPTRHDLPDLARRYETNCTERRIGIIAKGLGVSAASLRRLRTGWPYTEQDVASFPMVDAMGRVIGIRLRTDQGRKFAVSGGRNGMFIPTGTADDGMLLICEGPTSCAALLDLGFDAVGRPSCSGGGALLAAWLRKGQRRDVVIVGDHDTKKVRGDGSTFYPGQEGADRLASELRACCKSVRVIVPPFNKDARDWLAAGATRAVVMAVIHAANYVKRAG